MIPFTIPAEPLSGYRHDAIALFSFLSYTAYRKNLLRHGAHASANGSAGTCTIPYRTVQLVLFTVQLLLDCSYMFYYHTLARPSINAPLVALDNGMLGYGYGT